MVETKDIERPPKELIEGLSKIGSATATGELKRLGIRNAQILGPLPRTPGATVCGPAITLQFMPKREDVYPDDEYVDPESQLHRHALYHTQPGDVVAALRSDGVLVPTRGCRCCSHRPGSARPR